MDIFAEDISDEPSYRETLRRLIREKGEITAKRRGETAITTIPIISNSVNSLAKYLITVFWQSTGGEKRKFPPR